MYGQEDLIFMRGEINSFSVKLQGASLGEFLLSDLWKSVQLNSLRQNSETKSTPSTDRVISDYLVVQSSVPQKTKKKVVLSSLPRIADTHKDRNCKKVIFTKNGGPLFSINVPTLGFSLTSYKWEMCTGEPFYLRLVFHSGNSGTHFPITTELQTEAFLRNLFLDYRVPGLKIFEEFKSEDRILHLGLSWPTSVKCSFGSVFALNLIESKDGPGIWVPC